MVTDQKYKSAQERLIQIKANQAVKVVRGRQVRESIARDTTNCCNSDSEPGQSRSSRLGKEPQGLVGALQQISRSSSSNVTFNADATTKYLVNSEGTAIQHGSTRARLAIYARTKAEDGMELYRYEAFDAFTSDKLPGDEVVVGAIEKMAKDLLALRIKRP